MQEGIHFNQRASYSLDLLSYVEHLVLYFAQFRGLVLELHLHLRTGLVILGQINTPRTSVVLDLVDDLVHGDFVSEQGLLHVVEVPQFNAHHLVLAGQVFYVEE